MGAGFGRRRMLRRRRRGPRGLRRTCSGRTPTASAFLSSGPVLARFVLTLANMSVSTGLTSRGSILSALGRRRSTRMRAPRAADHSRLTLHPRSGAQSKSARRRLPCPCVAREFEICDSNPASAEKACAGGLVFSRGSGSHAPGAGGRPCMGARRDCAHRLETTFAERGAASPGA